MVTLQRPLPSIPNRLFPESSHDLCQLCLRRPRRHLLLEVSFAARDARLLPVHWGRAWRWRILPHLDLSRALVWIHLGRPRWGCVARGCISVVQRRWFRPGTICSPSVSLLLLTVRLCRVVGVLVLHRLSVLGTFLVGHQPLFLVSPGLGWRVHWFAYSMIGEQRLSLA